MSVTYCHADPVHKNNFEFSGSLMLLLSTSANSPASMPVGFVSANKLANDV